MNDFNSREVRAYGVHARDLNEASQQYQEARRRYEQALKNAEQEGISTDASTEKD